MTKEEYVNSCLERVRAAENLEIRHLIERLLDGEAHGELLLYSILEMYENFSEEDRENLRSTVFGICCEKGEKK